MSSDDSESENWLGTVLQNTDKDKIKDRNYVPNIYIPISKIGSGAYASVWMCYYKNKKKLMAVKIFKETETKSGKKEIEIYQKFNQYGIKHTIKMHDKFIFNNNICIVFDLMVGSLYDMIKKGGCLDNTNFRSGYSLDFVIKTTKHVLESLLDFHSRNILYMVILNLKIYYCKEKRKYMKIY
jgi:serine/threonine protein kinase